MDRYVDIALIEIYFTVTVITIVQINWNFYKIREALFLEFLYYGSLRKKNNDNCKIFRCSRDLYEVRFLYFLPLIYAILLDFSRGERRTLSFYEAENYQVPYSKTTTWFYHIIFTTRYMKILRQSIILDLCHIILQRLIIKCRKKRNCQILSVSNSPLDRIWFDNIQHV